MPATVLTKALAPVPKNRPRDQSRSRLRLVAAGVGLLAGLATFAFLGRSSGSDFSPYPLTPFVLASLQDESRMVDSRSFAGKGLVVNFFFSTCPPCRAELPILQSASQSLPSDVVMLGVDHGEPRTKAAPFVGEAGLTYDIALDEEGFVAPNVGAITFPATLFINSSGVVVKRHLGAISAKELRQGIDLVSHGS